MQKTAIMAVMSTALFTSVTVASANDNMSEDQCMAVMMAMSKLEISMIGKVPFDDATAALAEVRPSLPADVTPTVDDLIVVAEKEGNRGPKGRDRIRRPAGNLRREAAKMGF